MRTSSYCSMSAGSTLLPGSHEFADWSLPTHLTRNSVRPERRRLPSTRSTLVPAAPEPDAPELDAVADEITRWKYIAPAELAEFRCTDGLLNEFKMMWKLRHRFPLHFIAFKQMACHLPHEANVEQYFSRAALHSGSR